MSARSIRSGLTRRDFLRVGGLGTLALVGGAVPVLARSMSSAATRPTTIVTASSLLPPTTYNIHLAATDGYIQLPGRGSPNGPGGDPVYAFGFVNVPVGFTPNELDVYKGAVQFPAPIIGVDQESDVYLTMTNIGLVVRPDLDDSHTVHWHGFPNATAIFDGVPEVSIAVPVGRDFPYYYQPHRAGTFMYHCHFEDVEHVQMGMQGTVFVRPAGSVTRAYADVATEFDREFALILDEIWTEPHDNLEAIQETVWPNYKANYWTINGRSYPDTVLPNNDGSLLAQPLSSLIQVNAGERALLRLANLGYEQQAMQLPGIRLKVVGEDAARLRNSTGLGTVDLTYDTNTIYIGPGEGRDVLFTAPAYNGSVPTLTDTEGSYNRYLLRNRDVHRLTNNGSVTDGSELGGTAIVGLGGQVTEVRVYGAATLDPQGHPNETYPEPDSTAPYLDPWIV